MHSLPNWPFVTNTIEHSRWYDILQCPWPAHWNFIYMWTTDYVAIITAFYDSVYHDGEKGFEMWEEIGSYEGFALTWRAILRQQSKEDQLSWLSQSDLLSNLFCGCRASQHIRHLHEYIYALTVTHQFRRQCCFLRNLTWYIKTFTPDSISMQGNSWRPSQTFLTKYSITKTGKFRYASRQTVERLLILSGNSIKLAPENRWRIRISVSETNLPEITLTRSQTRSSRGKTFVPTTWRYGYKLFIPFERESKQMILCDRSCINVLRCFWKLIFRGPD